MEYKKHEILEHKLCKELEILEQKYENGPAELSMQDIEKMDKIYHALKSMATYNAMKEAEEYEPEGQSGRRMYRSMSTGNSYAEGYSKGYNDGINQYHHYPEHYMDRRW